MTISVITPISHPMGFWVEERVVARPGNQGRGVKLFYIDESCQQCIHIILKALRSYRIRPMKLREKAQLDKNIEIEITSTTRNSHSGKARAPLECDHLCDHLLGIALVSLPSGGDADSERAERLWTSLLKTQIRVFGTFLVTYLVLTRVRGDMAVRVLRSFWVDKHSLKSLLRVL